MLNLRQLNLQLALVGACSLGKDFENQPRPAENTAFKVDL